MWLVAITADTGASEDGNLYYCDFRVYLTKADAVAAVLRASPDAKVQGPEKGCVAFDIKDKAGNLFLVQPLDTVDIVPQIDPEDW